MMERQDGDRSDGARAANHAGAGPTRHGSNADPQANSERAMGPDRARARRDAAKARLAVDLISFATGVAPGDILAELRGAKPACEARQAAMYLTAIAFSMSYARVAAAFGRDRSTVMHACRLIEDRREDPVYDGWLSALEAALREAPEAAPQAGAR